MEQTTNVFNKGLQTDTHPMVQGNDTLSDALNATLVTMNGNEVVLQNDMGNAKIDNAYLPPGYLPVGMKEYGGIIYVAAYNPITNKSLIGSFPSPERKISVEDKDLGNTINLDKDFSFNKLEGINFLNNDILLIPLTSDTSLHAGDKFTVYSSYIWDNKDNITNFDNIILYQLYKDFLGKGDTYEAKIKNLEELLNTLLDDSKKEKINHNISIYLKLSKGKNLCYSPKNKKYTLSLGILNSLNEFVDITKSLVRWKDIDGKRPTKGENESDNDYKERFKTYKEQIKPIEFTNESDLLRFNTGYFIAKDFVDPLEEYTGNDKKLIAERLKIAVNSYAYKLIGPLYLKAELNHIKNFDFSIEGTKIPSENNKANNKAEILIKATITYNCPDGIDTMSGEGDNNYFDYFFGKLKDESIFPGFHLYKKSGETYKREYTTTKTKELLDENNNITIVIKDLYDKYYNAPETKYNPETNLYEVTIEKKYTIEANNNNKYEYYICVPSGYKDKDDESENYDDVYIKGLSTKGEIDFDKLGSGTLEINEWRFYNTMPTESSEGNTLLTYEFDVYPRIGHTFSDLEIKLSCSLVGLLIDTNDISRLKSIDEKAAATWFLKTYQDNGIIITPSNYTELIDKVNTLWINIDRNLKVTNNVPTLPQFFENNDVINKIKTHVENGGNLYLTKFASHLIKKLGRTNKKTLCECDYKNIEYKPKLYVDSKNDGEIFNNMIVFNKQSDKHYEFIESNSGGELNYRYYVFSSNEVDARDDYNILGRIFYNPYLTANYPSIIEFFPKKLENLDQKGSIIMDGSIYLWTGSLNVLEHNVETLTKNTINYLNSKKNKILFNIYQSAGEILIYKGNINISWEGLSPRTLYDVLITYKEKDENNLYIKDGDSDKVFTINNEWILTTELFNNCYSIDSLDFVDDYAKFNNLGENLPNGLKYLVDKLLTVKLDINENIKYTSKESSDYSGFKKLISKNSSSENVESSVKNTYNFNFILNRPSISISNEILYPAYINNELISDFKGKISFDKSIDEASILKNIFEYKSGTVSPFVNIVTNTGSILEQDVNFGGIIINVFNMQTAITQKIAAKLINKSMNIENCFNSFDTVFSENDNNFLPYYCFMAKCPSDCGGKSPEAQMYLVLYSTTKISDENIENSNRNELLFGMDCHRGDKIDVYNFSTYFDHISEFFNKNSENSQFIVGITNVHEAHGGTSRINACNSLDDYDRNHQENGNNIFIAWIRTHNGWVPFHIQDVTSNPNINFKEKIKFSNYYKENLKYFHTNFKSSPQSVTLYTIDLNNSYHYISPYDFSFTINYTIKAYTENDLIIKIGSNLKFKILKEYTLDNNISIKYKSNENFDETVKQAIQASLGEGLYIYDIDLDTMEDSEHNILRPEVNYIEIDSKLVKDFEDSNNIKVFSENDGIKIFSFPNKTITYQTTYPDITHTQYAAHAKSGSEGLSVIGLKFDIGAKKFVTNGG